MLVRVGKYKIKGNPRLRHEGPNAQFRSRAAIKRRGGKRVDVVSPLISALEAIAIRNTVCGGEVARGGKHTDRETGRRTTACWLSLSSIS